MYAVYTNLLLVCVSGNTAPIPGYMASLHGQVQANVALVFTRIQSVFYTYIVRVLAHGFSMTEGNTNTKGHSRYRAQTSKYEGCKSLIYCMHVYTYSVGKISGPL